MALLKVKKTEGFVAPSDGWHEVTIASVERGMYPAGTKTKYIDIRFEEFPEQVKLRVHQAFSKEDNSEWKVLSVFRYANAGISEILVTEGGEEGQMDIDDDPANLIGCKLNVYVYRNAKGYTDISENVAPAAFSNDWESYSKSEVEEKKKIIYESQIKSYISDKRFKENEDSWDSLSSNGAPVKEKETVEEDNWS